MNFYNFKANAIDGQEIQMSDYQGKVVMVVNTASECGFTPQYGEIQELYEKYRDRGFEVLAFPCNQFLNQEKGSNNEIKLFCDARFKTTFQLFEKVDVKGSEIHPLYEYLTTSVPGIFNSINIKWNFTKFIIDRKGEVVRRYSPIKKPMDMEPDISALL